MRFEGLPDVHYGGAEHFVDASAMTGISRWTLTGTTSQGTRLEVQGCDFYTFRNGKVIRKDFVLEDLRVSQFRPLQATRWRSVEEP